MGIFPLKQALEVARQRDLDLVEVAPNANPPVCRLIDYGKYIYERAKREREARKAQRSSVIKEVRLRPKTSEHDINFMIKRIRGFIADRNKVKVRVRFRGREITHPEIGRELLQRIAADLEDAAAIEQPPRMEGRSMLMILSPK